MSFNAYYCCTYLDEPVQVLLHVVVPTLTSQSRFYFMLLFTYLNEPVQALLHVVVYVPLLASPGFTACCCLRTFTSQSRFYFMLLFTYLNEPVQVLLHVVV